jgi:hypothetical protein
MTSAWTGKQALRADGLGFPGGVGRPAPARGSRTRELTKAPF